MITSKEMSWKSISIKVQQEFVESTYKCLSFVCFKTFKCFVTGSAAFHDL